MALPKKTPPTWTRSLAGLLFVLVVALAGAVVAQEPAAEGVPDTPEAAEAAAGAAAVSEPAAEGEYAAAPDPELQRIQALFDEPATPSPDAPPATVSASGSITTLLWQTLMVLLLICAAIIGGGAISKRLLSKTPVMAGVKLGHVLGRVYLSPKASLHYVKTGGRVLVLGVTPAGIHLITEFAAEAFEAVLAEPRNAKDETGPNFLEYLTHAQRPERASGDDDIANLRGEIQRLSEFLRESNREPHA